MPLTSLGAAAVGGGMHSLWNYNRANYMFDIPLKQSRQFQAQNIQLARFQLFREDVRDMAAVTIDKVQSYMIVNTLKLGFIITVFFNFDRTDTEVDKLGHEESQVQMIFSVTLSTAFFWLTTSIWFSMHAIILSQTLMTKMLLQVARIPLPSYVEIAEAAPNSRAFERNFADAFRLPFLHDTPWSNEREHREQTQGPRSREDTTRPPTGSATSTGYSTFRGWLTSPGQRPDRPGTDEDLHSQDGVTSPQSFNNPGGGDGPREPETVTIQELMEGAVESGPLQKDVVADGLEPHIKLFKLLRISWAPYDLYAKVSMELGTACLLSGLAYFAIYYLRDVKGSFTVQDPAWVTFFMLSVLAWWSSILDMTMPVWGHIILAILMAGGPVGVFIDYGMRSHIESPERHWALFRAFAFQTTWVMGLAWSAFGIDGKWPRLWRASLFLNVLHSEDGPKPFKKDVASAKFLGPKRSRGRKYSEADDADSDASSDSTDTASVVSTDDLWTGDGQEYWRAQLAAGPLLRCLDAAMCIRKLKHGPMRRKVRRTRDKLYEACRASGALHLETSTSLPVEGFWLRLEGADGRFSLHWVSPCGTEPEPHEFNAALEMSLVDILSAAQTVAAILHEQSYKWTEEDMRRIEAYGGEALPGLRSFIAQFRQSGSDTTCGLGSEGTHIFRGGVLLITLLWVTAFAWSWTTSFQHAESISARAAVDGAKLRRLDPIAPAGSRIAFDAPPWLSPSAIGCDGRLEQVALADELGVFVVNRTGGGRLGPLPACGAGAAPAAAAFDADGRVWAACHDRLESLPLPHDEAPSRVASLGVTGLHSLAMDLALPLGGGDRLHGIALRGGKLLGLQSHAEQGWVLAGTLPAPGGRKWVSAALRGGLVVALDSEGSVFEFDSATGRWDGATRLPAGLVWKGLCVLPDSDGWLAAGQPPSENGGPVELWRFPWRRTMES